MDNYVTCKVCQTEDQTCYNVKIDIAGKQFFFLDERRKEMYYYMFDVDICFLNMRSRARFSLKKKQEE